MLRDFIRLARPFWTSEERGIAWASAALLAVLTLVSVAASVQLVKLGGAIFDAVQNYSLPDFLKALEYWSVWAFLACGVYVYQSYVSMALSLRWRRWMTQHFIGDWLGGKAFYFWQVSGHASDNPDQRIAEDVRDFIATNDGLSGAVPLAQNLLQQVATLLAFVTLLWHVGGTLHLLHGRLNIPGYLVWCALIYAAVGSAIIAKSAFRLFALISISSAMKPTFGSVWCACAKTVKASPSAAARRPSRPV